MAATGSGFDCHDYEIPAGGDVTREKLIEAILAAQLEDGGWALSGVNADADMTGMALAALAPYYDKDEKVKAAVDRALTCLSEIQHEDGGFASVDGACAESAAQVIVALTSMGIDLDTDPRFVKNGHSVIDALCDYYVEGGGFRHVAMLERNGMATEQGYYALAAYYRFLNEESPLYDMSDVEINKSEGSSKDEVEVKMEISAGGITSVPDSLKQAGVDTVAEVKENLVQAIVSENKAIRKENIAHYDVTLMYSEDGGQTWTRADETHFPESGKVTVTIPYPKGTDSSYIFTVVHMFTSNTFGKTPGDVEIPKVTNTKDGIQFEVTGLSPISVGWTVPANPDKPQTGDDMNLSLYVSVMGISLVCMAAMLSISVKRSQKKNK